MHEDLQGLCLPMMGHRPSGKGLRSLLVPGLLAASVGIGGSAGAARPLPGGTVQSAGKAASLLKREGGKYALATQCIGGGQGIATVLEAV